jgi:hypothetical protein
VYKIHNPIFHRKKESAASFFHHCYGHRANAGKDYPLHRTMIPTVVVATEWPLQSIPAQTDVGTALHAVHRQPLLQQKRRRANDPDDRAGSILAHHRPLRQ